MYIKSISLILFIAVNILSGSAQQVDIKVPERALSIVTFFGSNCDDRPQVATIFPLSTCLPVAGSELYQKFECAEGQSTYSTAVCTDNQCTNCQAPYDKTASCVTNANNQSTLYSCSTTMEVFSTDTIGIASYASSTCDASTLMQLVRVAPVPTCVNNKGANQTTSNYYKCDQNTVTVHTCDQRGCKGTCTAADLAPNQCDGGQAYTCIIYSPPIAASAVAAPVWVWLSAVLVLALPRL